MGDVTLNFFFSQQKLSEERKKEYNLFLQEKAKTGRLKRAIPPVTSKVIGIINIRIDCYIFAKTEILLSRQLYISKKIHSVQ